LATVLRLGGALAGGQTVNVVVATVLRCHSVVRIWMASSGSGPFWDGAATWNAIVVALNVNAVCVSVLIWIGLSLSVVVTLMVIVACAIGIELGVTWAFHVSVVM
jgi:hypothetical protein